MNKENNHKQPPGSSNRINLSDYLVQQGFFKDEVKLTEDNPAQMNDLVNCAKNFVRIRKQNHGSNPLIYLEAISYCILHRSYKELEEPQRKALVNFAELVAKQVTV